MLACLSNSSLITALHVDLIRSSISSAIKNTHLELGSLTVSGHQQSSGGERVCVRQQFHECNFLETNPACQVKPSEAAVLSMVAVKYIRSWGRFSWITIFCEDLLVARHEDQPVCCLENWWRKRRAMRRQKEGRSISFSHQSAGISTRDIQQFGANSFLCFNTKGFLKICYSLHKHRI